MWFWFGLAVLALIGEALTGTFYLLLVAVGLIAAGLAALTGAVLGVQLLVCAVAVVLAALVLRRFGVLRLRSRRSGGEDSTLHLDVGQQLDVTQWQPDGSTQVWYRGAHWQARLQAGQAAHPGRHRIAAVEGNVLVLVPLGIV